MRTLILIVVLLVSVQLFAQVKVSGYYRKNGTYVQPHYRSNPDGNPYNNWSYPGNVNPYTGKVANGNSSTYLDNYYNRSSTSTSTYTPTFSSPSYTYPNSYNPNSTYTLNNTTYSTFYVSASTLNVRSGPSMSDAVITTLSYGNNVQILSYNSYPWYMVKVNYYDASTYTYKTAFGYAYSSYLTSSYLSYDKDYNTNTTSTKNYSSVIDHPYGEGKGKVTVWTNNADNLPNIISWSEVELRVQKTLIDTFYSQYRNSTTYVKDQRKSIATEVKDIDNYEGNIETIYEVVKNRAGKIIEIKEIPYNVSGDCYIEYCHYFDQNGKTFAFTRQTNFFNSGCTDKVAYEMVTEYYNKEFEQVSKDYQLVDENNTSLQRSECNFPYDSSYKREQNLLQFLKKSLLPNNIIK